MVANELMFGDWVYVPHNGSATHYARVVGIYSRDVVSTELDKMSGLIKADALEPIPLTPEILEKNGFKNYGESWYLPDDDVKVMVGFYMYKTAIHVKKGDDIFQKEVRCSYRACAENRDVHVHHLQHALRLCGIEKEIIAEK